MQDIKTRQQIASKDKWNLKDIYKNQQELVTSADKIERLAGELAGLQGKVHLDPIKAVALYYALNRELGSYFTYSRMQQDQDGAAPAYKAQMAKAEGLMVKARAAGAFLEPELLKLEESKLKALMEDPQHPQYRVYFYQLLRQKPHVLSQEQEELLAKAGEVFATASRTFNMLNNVDLPLPVIKGEGGQDVQLTHARYGMLMRSLDRDARKNAFEGMMNAFGAFSSTLSTLYISSIKHDVFDASIRHYPSARAQSLFANEIPESVYDGLIKEAHKAFPILDRYLRLRKKALGLDKLHLYDLYVPITSDFAMELPFTEAFQLVKKGLAPLGQEYQQLLDTARKNRWMDVYETKGKRSGAYSWGTYDSHPYVLLNHTDTLDSAMTLAHELGHAMHSWYSRKTQPYEQSSYALFAAEVASTANEVLVNHALMEQYKDDPKARLFFLTTLAEDFRTTFFRQTMFAEFEHLAHQMAENGEALTDQNLSDLYEKLNRQYYGREAVIDPEIRHEWMRIPHFYRAFYVYQYATGFSAAVYLAGRILQEGDKATKEYFQFLSAGGSKNPIDSLKLAGADMTGPKVIKGAMKVFEDTIAQMEALMAE